MGTCHHKEWTFLDSPWLYSQEAERFPIGCFDHWAMGLKVPAVACPGFQLHTKVCGAPDSRRKWHRTLPSFHSRHMTPITTSCCGPLGLQAVDGSLSVACLSFPTQNAAFSLGLPSRSDQGCCSTSRASEWDLSRCGLDRPGGLP